ncbi:MAG: hypothetical protein HYZ74_02555 [Elusimicrobia bacterium]|nr:hypothetical protein [Elusimicrobiota bacterium]
MVGVAAGVEALENGVREQPDRDEGPKTAKEGRRKDIETVLDELSREKKIQAQ